MQEQEILELEEGEKNSRKQDLLFCDDCGTKIVNFYAIRCKSCAAKLISPSKLSIKKLIERSSGKNHWNWKGDSVKYNPLHAWIRKHKPKVKFCEECGKEKKLDIANISGKYKRDINDFQWLCRSCHNKKDKIGLNFHRIKLEEKS